ncbi:MAG TPA: hypothetical protein VG435_10580 [Acidimicrobiales bacterium]|nr:hypothetical protein [Acidimicrobiales bacterium]
MSVSHRGRPIPQHLPLGGVISTGQTPGGSGLHQHASCAGEATPGGRTAPGGDDDEATRTRGGIGGRRSAP